MAQYIKFSESELDQLSPREYIVIKGARVNNLKNLSVAIPRNKLIVITGLSGSGILQAGIAPLGRGSENVCGKPQLLCQAVSRENGKT